MKRIVRLIAWSAIIAPFVFSLMAENALALFGGTIYFAVILNCEFFINLSKALLKDVERWESSLTK